MGLGVIAQKLQSVADRCKLASQGVLWLPGRPIDIRSVKIDGRPVPINFPSGEKSEQAPELARIVYLDCYRLAEIPTSIKSVLDIGANLGFFALAARRRFSAARIECYEPNHNLEPSLTAHCSAAQATYFVAAVGAKPGRVNLDLQVNSLHSVSHQCADGRTPQIAFSEAVGRLGKVDLLKLDCEGAEWDIFSDSRPWANVSRLVMEYHLWARPSLSIDDLRRQLRDLGFSRIRIQPDPIGNWGLAWADRTLP